MKNVIRLLTFSLITVLILTSCKKAVKESSQPEISDATLTKIYNHGFGTSYVQKTEEGYLVEGDIILTEEFLNSVPGGNLLRIASNEQYHTTNLVTGLPRNITISSSGSVNANVSAGIDAAIARYNAEGLQITMSRVASGGNINIKIVINTCCNEVNNKLQLLFFESKIGKYYNINKVIYEKDNKEYIL